MVSYANSLKDFFRINFVGKPFELSKLVYDNSLMIKSNEECNMVVKACRMFKGWQYLGQIVTVGLLLTASRYSRRNLLERKKQFYLVVMSLLPAVGFYFYSHFTYWHFIRALVKVTREREKNYEHLTKEQLEEYKIYYNQSKDYHKFIQQRIGLFGSVMEVLKFKN